MNIFVYFFIALTWFFSGMSLLTLVTGYGDPVMLICAGIFFLGAVAFGFMAKASMLPKPDVKVVEISPSALVVKGTRYPDWEDFQNSHHYDEWLDDGAPDDDYFAQRPEYQVPAQRRHLDDDE